MDSKTFKKLKVTFSVLVYYSVVSSALVAAEQRQAMLIECRASDGASINIDLNGLLRFDTLLNCISADFVSDMTPCAPNGGYGVSAGTGLAGLVELSYNWQTPYEANYGVTYSTILPKLITFIGTFGQDGNGNPNELWRIEVNRISGQAISIVEDNKLEYICTRIERKF